MEGRGREGKCFKFKKNSDSEDRLFENAQVEDKNAQMKDKTGLKNKKKKSKELWDSIKSANIQVIGAQEECVSARQLENIFEETIT